jgi:5-methylcytosine-specific restriction endonuclease McrA
MATLVLNNSWQPLGGISETDGVILVATDAAWALKNDPERVYRSQKITIPAPKIIVLKHFQRAKSFRIRPAALTNHNLFVRDNYTCQYCGKHKDELYGKKKLTRDHIYPTSLGGKNEWLNVTTACNDCNSGKKRNRTLAESGMNLLSQPMVPVTWTVRGKSLLNKEQIEFIEEMLSLKDTGIL